MGAHAGEFPKEIFSRKIDDIKKTGKTFWVISSYKANPTIIQKMKKLTYEDVYCVFIEASTKGGARPTTQSKQAVQYSEDKQNWNSFSKDLTPVTGNIAKNSHAIVFDELKLSNEKSKINLWDYAEFDNEDEPIFPKQGTSTICCIKKNMSESSKKIKSNLRDIIAIGRLDKLGAVWIR